MPQPGVVAALQQHQVAVRQETGAADVEIVVLDDLERADLPAIQPGMSASPRGPCSAMATISPAIGEAAGA